MRVIQISNKDECENLKKKGNIDTKSITITSSLIPELIPGRLKSPILGVSNANNIKYLYFI